MLALSVKYPWCELIAQGKKTIEIRSWKTDYRGPLAIVSSKKPDWENAGMVVCICGLKNVRPVELKDCEAAMVDFSQLKGVFAWELGEPQKIEPKKIKGRLGLYEIELP